MREGGDGSHHQRTLARSRASSSGKRSGSRPELRPHRDLPSPFATDAAILAIPTDMPAPNVDARPISGDDPGVIYLAMLRWGLFVLFTSTAM